MSFTIPDSNELTRIAGELDLPLAEEEAAEFLKYLQGFEEGYRYLEQPAGLPAGNDQREYHWSNKEDNSCNAWYVKCSIKESDNGPLEGKKIAVKDNIFVAGLPFSAGASVLKDFVADYDATTVRRILEAGAEIVGKSNCEYFCLSGGSCTSHAGVVDNPRKKGYSTGGSSSGSAALVAANEVDMALGTDQGGSVRIPSSWSGCYGMKATMGVVPYTGGMPIETSIDYIGPMTSCVEDNALLLEVLSGFNESPGWNVHAKKYTDSLGRGVKGLKIGVLREGFGHPLSEDEVDSCVRQAAGQLASMGATVEEISVPMHLSGLGIWGGVVTDGFWRTLELNGLGYNYDGFYSPALFEAMKNVSLKTAEMPFNAQLLFLLGKYLSRFNGKYYAAAKNHVHTLRAAYDQALGNCDLLLLPTTVTRASANPVSVEEASTEELMASAFNQTINTCQFNATGHPAISIPCGLRDELPVGLMLVGRAFDEGLIYQAAHAYEQNVDWLTE